MPECGKGKDNRGDLGYNRSRKERQGHPVTQKRLLSYDAVRVVAVMMIVMIHVSAYVVQYDKDPASLTFAVGNVFNGLSRAGTPMFMMLTGALLLDEKREKPTRVFYRLKNPPP